MDECLALLVTKVSVIMQGYSFALKPDTDYIYSAESDSDDLFILSLSDCGC